MANWKTCIFLVWIGISTSGVRAMPPVQQRAELYRSVADLEIDYQVTVDANQLSMFVTNIGSFGRDNTNLLGRTDGLYFPAGYHTTILYSGGLMLGALVDGAVRVSAAGYPQHTYSPGPMKDGTFQPDSSSFRVYKIFRDLYENGFYDDPRPVTDPQAQKRWDDYHNWPAEMGAPTYPDGLPRFYGDQTLWSVFNDADPATHTNLFGSSSGLGVEIQQTTFALDISNPLKRCIFTRYLLINNGAHDLDSMYVTLWGDPDIGDPNDDRSGCDISLDLGYAYNAQDVDSLYGVGPPSVGFCLLNGPLTPSAADSAQFLWEWRQGYRNLPMTSFIRTISGTDQLNAQESYWYMQGRDAKNGGYAIFDPRTFYPTTYMVSGDPITGSGWVDDAARINREVSITVEQTIHDYESPIEPPLNVFESPDYYDLWHVSSDQPGDPLRFDHLGHIGTGVWEMRFVDAMFGSLYYDWDTRLPTAPALAPFEVWSEGQRLEIFIDDINADGLWSPGDVVYFWEELYHSAPYLIATPADSTLRIGRIIINDSAPLDHPVIRFTSTETADTLPGADGRFMVSTGPFHMAPGDTQEASFAIMVGADDTYLQSISDLETNAAAARDAWSRGFDGPHFLHPPTPVRDTLFEVIEGEEITFTVSAIDSTLGDTVTLTVGGMPSGAVLSPSLPLKGNPARTTFSWTPGAGQIGNHQMLFSATDLNTGFTETYPVGIRVLTANVPPEFSHPPTPACDTAFNVVAGDTLEFIIEVFDVDKLDDVTLTIDELPQGALLTPALPATGNPVQTTFRWTPDYSQLGSHTFNFGAIDPTGAVAETCSFTVIVSSAGLAPEFVHPPTPGCETTIITSAGVPVSITVEAFDPVAADRVTLSVANLPAGAVLSNALPATGNPVTTTLTWQPAYSQLGLHTVQFAARDSIDGLAAQCSFIIEVISADLPPIFAHPPTPKCDSIFTIEARDSICLIIEAFDEIAADRVTLSVTGLPPTVVAHPLLPVTGNPVNSQICWRPTYAELGHYPVVVTATDSIDGLAVQCPFLFQVVSAAIPPEFVHPATPACDTVFQVQVGDTVQFNVHVLDVIDVETVTLSADGVPAGAVITPALPSSGNPVHVTFYWVPISADVGGHSLAFTVTDSIDGLTDECLVELAVTQNALEIVSVTPTGTLQIDSSFSITFNYPVDTLYLDDEELSPTIGFIPHGGRYSTADNRHTIVFHPFNLFPPLSEVSVDLSGLRGADGQTWAEGSQRTITFQTGYGVYSGDLNNDGRVDSLDVLPIAMHWRQEGPTAAADGWRTWGVRPARDWSPATAVYADANGDGLVDETDLFPIGRHWHRTHGNASPVAGAGADFDPTFYQTELRAFYDAIREDDSPFMRNVRTQLEHLLGVAAVPQDFFLAQNHPNPFNAETSITFALAQREYITLTVYDALGRTVRVLAQGDYPPGSHTLGWDGLDGKNLPVSSGVYFYTLTGKKRSETRKMMLLK